MRRVLAQRAFVAAVVAIAAALALALYLFNGGDGEGWQRVNDDASGIRLSYPREWEVQQVGRYCRRNGPGLLISNVRRYTLQNVEIPNGCTNQWEVSGLPNAYVLVDVSLFASPFPRTRDQPETTMPLELDRFERPPERHNYAFEQVTRDGNEYSVRAWFGPRASRENQDAVARVIRSIEFGSPSSP
jgi:hypothetical protein